MTGLSISPVEGHRLIQMKGTDDICWVSTKDAFTPTESWKNWDVFYTEPNTWENDKSNKYDNIDNMIYCSMVSRHWKRQGFSSIPHVFFIAHFLSLLVLFPSPTVLICSLSTLIYTFRTIAFIIVCANDARGIRHESKVSSCMLVFQPPNVERSSHSGPSERARSVRRGKQKRCGHVELQSSWEEFLEHLLPYWLQWWQGASSGF